jgi:hypothetical protein
MFGQTGTDMGTVVSLTTQIQALTQQLNMTADPTVKAMLQGQIAVTTAQLAAVAQHQQAQADASANLLNGLALFATLSGVVGTSAPTILNLFKIGH